MPLVESLALANVAVTVIGLATVLVLRRLPVRERHAVRTRPAHAAARAMPALVRRVA